MVNESSPSIVDVLVLVLQLSVRFTEERFQITDIMLVLHLTPFTKQRLELADHGAWLFGGVPSTYMLFRDRFSEGLENHNSYKH